MVFVGKIIRKSKLPVESIGMGAEVEGFENLDQLRNEDAFVNIFTVVFD